MSEQVTQEPQTAEKKKRTPRPPLEISAMTAAIVGPDVVAKRRRTLKGRGVRKGAQLEIDKLVRAAHEAWVKGGRPEEWEKRSGAQITVPASQAETLYTAMYNAGSFLGLRVRRGDVQEFEKDGKAFVDVVFTVTDVPAEEDKAADDGKPGERVTPPPPDDPGRAASVQRVAAAAKGGSR
jgi:hypothetical protein